MMNNTNTFTTANNLYFNIVRNNKLVSSDNRAPYTDKVILDNIEIPAKTEHVYSIDYEFKDTGVNQDVDQNKTFKTTIKVAIDK